MGRKFRLSAHLKNEERKRSFVVSVQRDAVSVMIVSFPAECYRTAPAPSLGVLQERLLATNSVPACK